jgi:hypothetical protein
MRVTKKQLQVYIREQLANDYAWAVKAMVKIHDEGQTGDEILSGMTISDNGVGFNGMDAGILSSFVKGYKKYKKLTEKQMVIVYKKMPKYWKQVMNMSDSDKLKDLYVKSLEN